MDTNRTINVKLVGQDIKPGKLVMIGLLSLAPVAIAILMQNPALRQALQMRLWLTAREASRKAQKLASKLEAISGHRYDLARL